MVEKKHSQNLGEKTEIMKELASRVCSMQRRETGEKHRLIQVVKNQSLIQTKAKVPCAGRLPSDPPQDTTKPAILTKKTQREKADLTKLIDEIEEGLA